MFTILGTQLEISLMIFHTATTQAVRKNSIQPYMLFSNCFLTTSRYDLAVAFLLILQNLVWLRFRRLFWVPFSLRRSMGKDRCRLARHIIFDLDAVCWKSLGLCCYSPSSIRPRSAPAAILGGASSSTEYDCISKPVEVTNPYDSVWSKYLRPYFSHLSSIKGLSWLIVGCVGEVYAKVDREDSAVSQPFAEIQISCL